VAIAGAVASAVALSDVEAGSDLRAADADVGPGVPVRRSNNAFLKRQKELLRNQKKQEKRDRLAAARAQRGGAGLEALDADEDDLAGLGLADRALPAQQDDEP
jgi:ADP-ribosylglycohydrolase